ncbi:MAG: hypothetical protein IPH75_08015 [bacterium]|nr:hypothetical protein [bacterium]
MLNYQIIEGSLVYTPLLNVTSRTHALYGYGLRTECFFFCEFEQEYNPDNNPEPSAGMLPGALFQVNNYADADTICAGYDYMGTGDFTQIGYSITPAVDTCLFECDYGHLYVCSTMVDSVPVYASNRSFVHDGVGTYQPDLLDTSETIEFALNSAKSWRTRYSRFDLRTLRFPTYTVTAPRLHQYLGATGDTSLMYFDPNYSICPWGGSSTDCGPQEYPNDTLPFVLDSVTNWKYVPEFNLTLPLRTVHMVQNGPRWRKLIAEYQYDSTKAYLLKQSAISSVYNDSGTVKTSDTMVTTYLYDSLYDLFRSISATYDTVYYTYDSDHRMVTTIDSSYGSLDLTVELSKQAYYPNGALKYVKGPNGDSTIFVPDFYGRDSVTFGALDPEDEPSTIKEYYNSSNTVTGRTKIESGVYRKETTYYDTRFRRTRSELSINDSTVIKDGMEYDPYGNVLRSARARYSGDTTLIWTHTAYDANMRPYKHTYPDGSFDSTRFRDAFTLDTRSVTGLRQRLITNFFGNVMRVQIGDSSACDTCFSAISSANATFSPWNSPIRVGNFAGLVRAATLDAWGRQILFTDPDIGAIRTWYDRASNVRFARRNSETTYQYMKYDAERRLIEEGVMGVPDTSKMEVSSYPEDTVGSKRVYARYRHDNYSNSTIAADTVGGLSYCLGRLTEVVDTSGYTYYYYDLRGRVGQQTTSIRGLSSVKKLRFSYYANDALKRITYPDGTYTEYGYDVAGRLHSILQNDTTYFIRPDSIQYAAWGAIERVAFGGPSRLKTHNLYDILGRLDQTVTWSQNNRLFGRGYQYANWYMTKEFDLDTTVNGTGFFDSTNVGQVRTFGYDYRGRLTSAWLKDPNGVADTHSLAYQYDLSNNLNMRKLAGIDSLYYTRHSASNCDSVVKYSDDSTLVLTRDSRGCIVVERKYNGAFILDSANWYRKTTYAYDHRNLLKEATFQLKIPLQAGDAPDTVLNYYDFAGRKVKQLTIYQVWIPPDTGGGGIDGFIDDGIGTDGSVPGDGYWQRRTKARYYIWSGNQVVCELDNPSTISNINVYGLGKLLARWEGNNWQYLISDYLNTVRAVIRYDGEVKDRLLEYYPYGEPYSGSFQNLIWSHRSFLSKENDQVGELDFGPRYYSREMGRFLSPDPILSGPSPYSYAEGNPVMNWDPSGLVPDPASAWAQTTRDQMLYGPHDCSSSERMEREFARVAAESFAAECQAGIPYYATDDPSAEVEMTWDGSLVLKLKISGKYNNETKKWEKIDDIVLYAGDQELGRADSRELGRINTNLSIERASKEKRRLLRHGLK